MNKFKRVFALALALALTVAITACSNGEGEAETTTAVEDDTTVEISTDETETTIDGEQTTAAETETTVAADATTAAPASDPYKLNTTDAAAALAYYKNVIAVNAALNNAQNLSLDGKITGEGAISSIISMFSGTIGNILKNNSTASEVPPGKAENLTAADITSASAVADDQYTTLTLNIKEQTDGLDGKLNEGPVGRAVGVLDGVDSALNELSGSGIKVDVSGGSIEILYNNASVVVKVDNKTGKIVEGTWQHTANIKAQTIKVSFLSIPLLEAKILFLIETT